MKRLWPLLAAPMLVLILGRAHAAPPAWGGSIGLSSNYLVRGISRSDNDPAVSGDVHVQFAGNFFAGIGAITSRIQPRAGTTLEVNATAGFAGALNEDWSGKLSVTHYETPWSDYADFYRYDEITGELGFRDRWFMSVTWSPNTSLYAPVYGPVAHRNTVAYETSYRQALKRGFSAFAGLGYYDLDDLFDEGYWYGSLGASLIRQKWQFDLSWVMPESAAQALTYRGAAEQRLLATVTRNF
jgi:uncharacterized protein (TIGR02001 family)